ncbi:thermonuclease family protein [Mycoplasmopsis gallinacea]|uniref:TNase-like domain-containing protein n=1 Tax=Mycoplasmopsis gallinacea TaxID=29556 RepID=A0A449A3U1_9BACT|nr:hypothetical protein [Mycoplasmopsis gallinacea]VEU58874.1 Uncharacterised protein [Mycoplasmopsis gallinacea]
MKLKTKILCLAVGISPIAMPLAFVSCNNEKTQSTKQNVLTINIQEKNTDSENFHEFDLELRTLKNKQQRYRLKPINGDFDIAWYSKAQSYVQQKMVEKVTEALNPLIEIDERNKFLNLVTDFKNVPEEINLNYNGITFNVSLIPEETRLSADIINRETIDLETNKITVKYQISYKLTYKGLDVQDFSNSIYWTKKIEKDINPTLLQTMNIISSDWENVKSRFIPINADWSKIAYRDGEIISQADGDTFTVRYSDGKEPVQQIIRLNAIDTPEKAIKTTQASSFEKSFALLATKFGEMALPRGTQVRIGFNLQDTDTYGRLTSDIFFGENFQYSYNVEITRAGFTLPASKTGWNSRIKEPNTYENVVYRHMADAFDQAIENSWGAFTYWNTPIEFQKNVYLLKPNSAWQAFYSKSADLKVKDIK